MNCELKYSSLLTLSHLQTNSELLQTKVFLTHGFLPRNQKIALLCVQRAIRNFMVGKLWPWWQVSHWGAGDRSDTVVYRITTYRHTYTSQCLYNT